MIAWYGYLYLAILGLLTLAGIIEELKKPGGSLYALGTFTTLIILVAFVAGSFIPDVGQAIGYFSLPMLLAAIVYDFYLSGRNLILGSKYFGEPLDEVKSRMDLLTATLIVAPGYLAGFVILYRTLVS
ncbi:MAG: hypothetical protein COA74_08110 [Gammaproteobacteria bacterium]|nr:MAG: hypothetical protein COA74_08110 [Gammaproteobacteria bacterium]